MGKYGGSKIQMVNLPNKVEFQHYVKSVELDKVIKGNKRGGS